MRWIDAVVRWSMSAAFVAGATGAAGGATPGDHAVAVAVITAVATIAAVVIGPIVTSRLRDRRQSSSSDALVKVLMEQLSDTQKENARLREDRGEK